MWYLNFLIIKVIKCVMATYALIIKQTLNPNLATALLHDTKFLCPWWLALRGFAFGANFFLRSFAFFVAVHFLVLQIGRHTRREIQERMGCVLEARYNKRTLTVGGSITIRLVSSLHLTASLHTASVTRLGNLLDFGQLLKPLVTINLPKSPTFLGNFVKVSKSLIFLVKSFLGNFLQVILHTAKNTFSFFGQTLFC